MTNKSLSNKTETSHLTTLVNRFLTTLENVKHWNQLNNIVGEARLRHHLSNIIEYTFYYHKKLVTEQEVETLVQFLEEGGNRQ
jgi:hypothetical protein